MTYPLKSQTSISGNFFGPKNAIKWLREGFQQTDVRLAGDHSIVSAETHFVAFQMPESWPLSGFLLKLRNDTETVVAGKLILIFTFFIS